MGVKSGMSGGGYGIMESHVNMEKMNLGRSTQKMAQAKAKGAGIGGILGAVLGVVLAPFTGGSSLLLAGIGGGLGAAAGSKIGESQSGVSFENDIMGGDFMMNSRSNVARQLEGMETSSILSGVMTGISSAGFIEGGLGAFKAGASQGGGFMGGMKGIGNYINPMTSNTLVGKNAAVSPGAQGAMKVNGQWIGSGAPTGALPSQGLGAVLGGTGSKGIGKALYGAADDALGGLLPGGKKAFGEGTSYGLLDKALGGVLPGGQAMGEGYISQGIEAIGGLLGPKASGDDQYQTQIADQFKGKNKIHTKVQDLLKVKMPSLNPFQNSQETKDFQAQYNSLGYGPEISEDGMWGPETMNAWRLYQGMQNSGGSSGGGGW